MEVSEKEYFEWKLKVVSAVLPALIDKYEKDIDNESHRQTIAWQAVSMAEAVLHELGLE
jgi:hypothetical protein